MDYKDSNEKLINEYQVKNDGSLADELMKGCKKFLAEEALTTELEIARRKKHHDTVMSCMVNNMIHGASNDII